MWKWCRAWRPELWALNTALWFEPRRLGWMGGGNDYPGMHSLLVDPRNAQHITLAISCGGVWQTVDGGQSWSLTAEGMRADYMPAESAQYPNTQDPHRMVQCAAQPDVLWVQHHCGLYRSADAGQSWQGIATPAPSGFGFAVACDPVNPLRAWFAPAQADTHRYDVDGKMVEPHGRWRRWAGSRRSVGASAQPTPGSAQSFQPAFGIPASAIAR